MKRSAIQYLTGTLGICLIIVSSLWVCRTMSPDREANAASSAVTSLKAVAGEEEVRPDGSPVKTGIRLSELVTTSENGVESNWPSVSFANLDEVRQNPTAVTAPGTAPVANAVPQPGITPIKGQNAVPASPPALPTLPSNPPASNPPAMATFPATSAAPAPGTPAVSSAPAAPSASPFPNPSASRGVSSPRPLPNMPASTAANVPGTSNNQNRMTARPLAVASPSTVVPSASIANESVVPSLPQQTPTLPATAAPAIAAPTAAAPNPMMSARTPAPVSSGPSRISIQDVSASPAPSGPTAFPVARPGLPPATASASPLTPTATASVAPTAPAAPQMQRTEARPMETPRPATASPLTATPSAATPLAVTPTTVTPTTVSVAPSQAVAAVDPSAIIGTGMPGSQNQTGPQEAVISLEKLMPEEVQVNRHETIKLIVRNTGGMKARHITLRDVVPARTKLVSTDPKITAGQGGELLWTGFELAPKEEKEFSYEIIPQEEGEIGSVASLSFQTEVSSRVKSTRPKIKVDVQAPKEVLIGQPVILDISVSNPGTGTATNVVLVEKVPDGLQHAGGKLLDNKIDTIAPQETKKLSLTLQSIKPGKTVNTLKVTAENGILEEVATEIQVNSPELKLEIVGSNMRYLDREATYVLKVSNPGTASAADIRLKAELPKNVEFVRTNNLGEYDREKHCVFWELVELPANIAPGELELAVKPIEAGTGRIVLRGEGRNELSAEVTQDITIDGMPALSYEVRSLSDPVEVGKEAQYEIRLTNRGTKNSSNINIQILIPDEMKIVGSDGPTQYRPIAGGVRFDRLDSVAPKATVVYKIRAVCSKPGDHRIKTQVSSDDMELLVKEESTRVYF